MPEPTPILTPRSNANDETVTVAKLLVPNGTRVARGAPVLSLETSKAAVDVEAPTDGFVFHCREAGDEVSVGDPLGWISEDPAFNPAAHRSSQAAAPARVPPEAAAGAAGPATFTRKAKKLAEQHGLDASAFAGLTMVREEDVLARIGGGKPAASGATAPTAVPASPLAAAAPAPSAASALPAELAPHHREKQTATKRSEVRALTAVRQAALPSRVVCPCPLEPIRKLAAREERAKAIKPSLGEIVAWACSRVLPKHPLLNAFYWDGAVHAYDEVNLGLALNIPEEGLRVAVVPRADTLPLDELSLKAKDLVLRYYRGKLREADLAGGTFTISDLSSTRVVDFDPVLNAFQSAILGIGAPAPGAEIFNLILTFDHRVLDGLLAGLFVGELVATIERSAGEAAPAAN